MKVTIAEYAGFCFGVERAMQIVNDARKSHDGSVVTYGPIIHNPQVVQELKDSNVDVIESVEEAKKGMTVVIRTHGIPVDEHKKLEEVANIIDATCPFVQKVQRAAKNYSDKKLTTIVVGEMDHPEVKSIVSYIDNEFFVINSVEEAKDLNFDYKYGIVAQTTQSQSSYANIVDELKKMCKHIEVSQTICSATQKRQDSAIELAKSVDAMIIVGGKNSANTTRLYKLCKEICGKSYHIETAKDLTSEMFEGAHHVGISAGASTPTKLVQEVKEYILERANG